MPPTFKKKKKKKIQCVNEIGPNWIGPKTNLNKENQCEGFVLVSYSPIAFRYRKPSKTIT